jgi:putative tryptophan/tyrosine transport system substrate-binding protein
VTRVSRVRALLEANQEARGGLAMNLTFAITVLLLALATPLAAGAQQAQTRWRIGYLSPVTAGTPGHVALRKSLRALGYIEGHNIVFDDRFADGHPDRLPMIAADLVRQNPDVIVAASPPAVRAALGATKAIPIVMVTGDDPVRSGFVTSLARPGGNITGVTFLVVDLFAKQMELLKQVVPHMSRVAFLWDPTMPTTTEDLTVVRAAARSLGLRLQIVPVRGSIEYGDAFAAMVREKAGGLIIAGSPTFNQDRRDIAALTAKHRLPSAWGFKEDAEAGGLISYGASQADALNLAAGYVDKILKGTRRSSDRAADEIQLGHQPEDRQGAGPHHPAVAAAAGGRGDSVVHRRAFLGTLAGGLVAAPLAVEAREAGKVYRLGILSPGARPVASYPATASLLLLNLRTAGYVSGRNLAVEERFADGKLGRLPDMARDLVRRKVDVMFAASPVAVQAAKDVTQTVPIVMLLNYSDPVALGFVTSLARPGGNITGVVLAAEPTIAGKRLELLKQLVPAATRIAVLVTGEPQARTQVEWAEKVAPTLGVKLLVVVVRGTEYEPAFDTMVAERAQALFVTDSVLFATDRARIIQLAAQHHLAAIYGWRDDVQAGGLIAYGGNTAKAAERIASYVERIFRGARPADLPVERATTIDLAINLKTAKALGLTIPQSLLLQADELIQ